LVDQVQSLNELLASHNGSAPVQKIFSSAEILSVSFRVPGKTLWFWLGRGAKYQGLNITEEAVVSDDRVQDKFLHYLRKNLVNFKISKVQALSQNGFVLVGAKSRFKSYFVFIWKNHELIFSHLWLNEEGLQGFMPWKDKKILKIPEEISVENLILDQHNEFLDDAEFVSFKMESYKAREKIAGGLQTRKRKYFERKTAKIQLDLNRINGWCEIENKLLSLDPEINEAIDKPVFNYNSLSLKFKNGESFYEKKNLLFQKIKQMKKARGLLEKRLLETAEEFAKYKEKPESFISIKRKTVQPRWIVDKSSRFEKKLTQSQLNAESFVSDSGQVKIMIGRDARSNDELRNKFASKDDYWFHLDNRPSPHLFLKLNQEDEVNNKHLVLVASILNEFSGLNLSEIDMIYTRVRFLKSKTGQAGSVTPKKVKYIRMIPVQNWREILSNL